LFAWLQAGEANTRDAHEPRLLRQHLLVAERVQQADVRAREFEACRIGARTVTRS
jgi:hypothetical protein